MINTTQWKSSSGWQKTEIIREYVIRHKLLVLKEPLSLIMDILHFYKTKLLNDDYTSHPVCIYLKFSLWHKHMKLKVANIFFVSPLCLCVLCTRTYPTAQYYFTYKGQTQNKKMLNAPCSFCVILFRYTRSLSFIIAIYYTCRGLGRYV